MKRSALLISIILVLVRVSLGQTTAFTYQGKLADGGTPATAQYDFTFKLYDSVSGGTQIGSAVAVDDLQVTAGIFTVNLNFGSSPFTSEAARYLEIAVRPGASSGAYTPLVPRQPITSSPYSVQTVRAASAAVADNALNLGGAAANQFVQTNDTRLTDDRNPLPNSPNYLQNNSATPQPANFSISGNGSANVFNAAQYNIGGNRILSNPGSQNLFVGVGAGSSNTTGGQNSFFGLNAGFSNTSGANNSFYGVVAGQSNTTGVFNSFYGASAGGSNTSGGFNSFFGRVAGFANTTGSSNSYFGFQAGENSTGGGNTFVGSIAGQTNTTGSSNTLVGASTNVGANNLIFATALGSGAVVSTSNTITLGRSVGQDTVNIPGNLSVTGTIGGTVANATTANNALNLSGVAANQFVQTSDTRLSDARTPLAGSNNYLQNTTAQQASSNFNISGNGTVGGTLTSNVVNATQFNINGQRVLRTDDISRGNTFVGINAGLLDETNGNGANSFFGWNSGRNAIAANNNSFFGTDSGVYSSVGDNNAFFGFSAGKNNGFGSSNSFFGANAGLNNAGTFEGASGNNNSFFGYSAGIINVTGQYNTAIGYNANFSANNLTNAMAIGANSMVSQSNSLVLGSINGVNNATADTNVGIGTTAPTYKLQIVDSSNTGLRVLTNTSGGTVASFGGLGNFVIDTVAIPGGRFTVKENGNVGVGTNNPNTKLQIAGGSVYIANPNSLIITSPNGACWFITVNNAGALSTISVACP